MTPSRPLLDTDRSRLRQSKPRGSKDRALARAILDEGCVVHVAFSDGGQPIVVPMAYARVGDEVVLHGAVKSRAMRLLGSGADVCLEVTHLDGLVLAKSALHHSMNYRSVIIHGRARAVDDLEERRRLLEALVDFIIPGRSAACRPPTDAELRATAVVAVPIDEATVKVREGGPKDDPEDLALEHWAGVIPLRVERGAPVPASAAADSHTAADADGGEAPDRGELRS